MKKLLAMMLMMLPMLIVSCSKGDEVWGLRIGESRDNIAKQLKERGYEVENFSDDSYLVQPSAIAY